jgi:hypothetical protein
MPDTDLNTAIDDFLARQARLTAASLLDVAFALRDAADAVAFGRMSALAADLRIALEDVEGIALAAGTEPGPDDREGR